MDCVEISDDVEGGSMPDAVFDEEAVMGSGGKEFMPCTGGRGELRGVGEPE